MRRQQIRAGGRSRNVSFNNCKFRCAKNCDSCCRRSEGVFLTMADWGRISSQGFEAFFKPSNHPLFPHRLKTEKNKCIFLSSKKKCLIYNTRPLLCRIYPLQINFSNDGDILWCVEHCPGLDEPTGRPINAEYLNAVEQEMERLEGKKIIEKIKKYVLQQRKKMALFTPVFNKASWIEWETKKKFREIIEELIFLPEFEDLSIRGRIECIIYDLWPKFKNIIFRENLAIENSTTFVGLKSLEKAYEILNVFLPRLLKSSIEHEKIHLEGLENRGKLVSDRFNKNESGGLKESFLRVHGYDGRTISLNPAKLMHMLPFSENAGFIEEAYFRELLHREGKFGGYNVDLTVDAELFFLFLTADSLELKANAFAIEKKKEEIGENEMKEGIWIIDRMPGSLLKRAMERYENRGGVAEDSVTEQIHN